MHRPIMTTECFVEKARLVHGTKYDYSHTIYRGSDEMVEIICPQPHHGHFWKRPANHLQGQGCMICSGSKRKTKHPSQSNIPPNETDAALENTRKKYHGSVDEIISKKSAIHYFKTASVGVIILTIDKSRHEKWSIFFLHDELPSVLDFIIGGKLDDKWTSRSLLTHSHWTHGAISKVLDYTKEIPEFPKDKP